jgi:hypothetical protein
MQNVRQFALCELARVTEGYALVMVFIGARRAFFGAPPIYFLMRGY